MPESPRKRSTPSRKAEPDVVPAESATAKTAKAAKAAKTTEAPKEAAAAKTAKKAAKAAKPVEPVDAPAPKKATTSAGKAAKKAAAEPVQEPAREEPGTDEPEFLNRAARRAKGHKGNSGLPVSGKGPTYAGRGAVPGQRQWGARRSGG